MATKIEPWKWRQYRGGRRETREPEGKRGSQMRKEMLTSKRESIVKKNEIMRFRHVLHIVIGGKSIFVYRF
jgi:hypothetical protein